MQPQRGGPWASAARCRAHLAVRARFPKVRTASPSVGSHARMTGNTRKTAIDRPRRYPSQNGRRARHEPVADSPKPVPARHRMSIGRRTPEEGPGHHGRAVPAIGVHHRNLRRGGHAQRHERGVGRRVRPQRDLLGPSSVGNGLERTRPP